MEKLRMQTENGANINYEKLKNLFPNIITETIDGEGNVVRSIDKVKLEQMINTKVVDNSELRYDFIWPKKYETILTTNMQTNMTLRLNKEKSVKYSQSKNIFIEGENLEVLKLLKKSYYEKIKVIYIDPPYNTGNDFVYNDDYKLQDKEFAIINGEYNEDGVRLIENTKSNGKYHTNWLNMMYSRLIVARELLKDDGVIFISIDNHEYGNLKKICDEIFGENNFINTIIWHRTSTPPSLTKKIRTSDEYVLVYEKNRNDNSYYASELDGNDMPLIKNVNSVKLLKFPKGSVFFKYIQDDVIKSCKMDNVDLLNDIIVKDGVNQNDFECYGKFVWTQDFLNEELLEGTYFIVKTDKFAIRFQRKNGSNSSFKRPINYFELKLDTELNIGTNEYVKKELEKINIKNIFDYAKPVSLIRYLINSVCKFDKDAIVLDFFGGSGTTAHAVLDLNNEDNGNRRYIITQINETMNVEGYNTISEFCYDRIRNASIYYSNINQSIDTGFYFFKLDSSNMEDVFYTPYKTQKLDVTYFIDNVKDDRTEEDLIYQIILELGLELTTQIECKKINNVNVYFLNNNKVILCLNLDLTNETVKEIVTYNPEQIIVRNLSSEKELKNISEIIKQSLKNSCVLRIL